MSPSPTGGTAAVSPSGLRLTPSRTVYSPSSTSSSPTSRPSTTPSVSASPSGLLTEFSVDSPDTQTNPLDLREGSRSSLLLRVQYHSEVLCSLHFAELSSLRGIVSVSPTSVFHDQGVSSFPLTFVYAEDNFLEVDPEVFVSVHIRCMAAGDPPMLLKNEEFLQLRLLDNDALDLAIFPLPPLSLQGKTLQLMEGNDANYSLVLAAKPPGVVEVALTLKDSSLDPHVIATVDQVSLEFQQDTWDVPQVVTITVPYNFHALFTNGAPFLQLIHSITMQTSSGIQKVEQTFELNILQDVDVGVAMVPTVVAPKNSSFNASFILSLKPYFDVMITATVIDSGHDAVSDISHAKISVSSWAEPFWCNFVLIDSVTLGTFDLVVSVWSEDRRYNRSRYVFPGSVVFEDVLAETPLDLSPAPTVTEAKLRSSQWIISINFTVPTTQSRDAVGTIFRQFCRNASLFTSSSLSKLDAGSSPSICFWNSSHSLIIELPPHHPQPTPILQFQKNAIQATPTSIYSFTDSFSVSAELPPPRPVAARFGNLGNSVDVEFSGVSSISAFATMPCSGLFEHSVSLLGSQCTASWVSLSTLRVRLGSSAQLFATTQPAVGGACSPGRSLQLLPGAVAATPNSILSAVGCVNVLPPLEPRPPSPVLLGPRTVGSCEGVFLDGSSSFLGGGRRWSITWVVTQSSGSVSDAAIAALSIYLATQEKSLSVSVPNLLLPSGTVTFGLRIGSDFASDGATAYHTVTKASTPLPSLSSPQQLAISIAASQSYTVRVRGAWSPCGAGLSAASTPLLEYSWQAESVQLSHMVTSDPRALRLEPFSLFPGKMYPITANVTAFYPSTGMTASNTLTFHVDVPITPLVCTIDAFPTLIPRSAFHNVTASVRDPNVANTNVTWSWECHSDAAANCEGVGGALPRSSNSPATTTYHLPFGLSPGLYNVSVRASALLGEETLSCERVIHFEVVTADVPAITFQQATLVVKRPTTAVTVSAIVTHAAPLRILEWSLQKPIPSAASSALLSTLSMSNSQTLRLPAGALSPGGMYTFQLTATDSLLLRGSAEISVIVNSPPGGGHVSLSRKTAEFLQDKVDVAAMYWQDDEGNLPLQYKFGFVPTTNASAAVARASDAEGIYQLYSPSATAPGLLPPLGPPPHGTVLAVAYIRDSLGASTRCATDADGMPAVVRVIAGTSWELKNTIIPGTVAAVSELLQEASRVYDTERITSLANSVAKFLTLESIAPCSNCHENQTCSDSGHCICLQGWEGAECDTYVGPVDAQVVWSKWSECSLSCGGGIQEKYSTCQPARHGGAGCSEVLANVPSMEQRACNTQPCGPTPVDGGYSAWSEWSECEPAASSCESSGAGAIIPGQSRRYRSCTNPPPSRTGKPCAGPNEEIAECDVVCPPAAATCPGAAPTLTPGGPQSQCSGHGTCRSTDDTCTEDRLGLGCYMYCVCDSGWSGTDCALMENDVKSQAVLFRDAVKSLLEVPVDSTNPDQIQGSSVAVLSLASSRHEFSLEDEAALYGLIERLTSATAAGTTSVNLDEDESAETFSFLLSSASSLLTRSVNLFAVLDSRDLGTARQLQDFSMINSHHSAVHEARLLDSSDSLAQRTRDASNATTRVIGAIMEQLFFALQHSNSDLQQVCGVQPSFISIHDFSPLLSCCTTLCSNVLAVDGWRCLDHTAPIQYHTCKFERCLYKFTIWGLRVPSPSWH